MLPITLFFIFFSALCLAWSMTIRLRRRLVAKAIMDIPNERSMHAAPVPRGGGLAVMGVIILWMLIFTTSIAATPTLILIGAMALLLLISWIDDKRGVNPALRLGLHLIAAAIGSVVLGPDATLFQNALPFWLDRTLMILGWGWFMNLTNFMDGIDGITATQTSLNAAAIGAFAFLFLPEPLFLVTLAALTCGAVLGFAKLNWHPAQIFLGDAGSVPLGFLIGFMLLSLATKGYLVPALLIPLYYLADSGITITRRALARKKIWQAHREHFYQRATQGEGSPLPIVIWIAIANIGLAACALVAAQNTWLGAGLGVGILSLLLARLSLSSRKIKAP